MWYHISRSPQAQAQMLAADVPASLLQVLSVRGTGDEYDAHIGLATMALANLVGSAPKGPIKGEAVEFVVRFLGYAVKAQRFGGISWRVDDVLNPLLVLLPGRPSACIVCFCSALLRVRSAGLLTWSHTDHECQ